MGTIFRRGYTDKKTGKRKRIRTYSIKYRNSLGAWVTEPTDATQRHIALRLLLERERQIQGAPAVPQSSAATPAPPLALALVEIVERYIPYLRLRVKCTTLQTRERFLQGTLKRLAVSSPPELTPDRIQAYVEGRLRAKITPQTVNLEMRFLRRALGWGQEQGFLTANPLQSWRPLRERPAKKRRAMQPDEVQRLLPASPLHRRIVYATFLAGGLRRSELIKLLIPDLILDRQLLLVRPEISKTGKLRRIFLPQGLVDILREYLVREADRRRQRQESYLQQTRQRLARLEASDLGDTPRAEKLRALENQIIASRGHAFLFVNGKGLPIRRNNNIVREFRHDLRAAGINSAGLDLHSLRHTCNTVLLQGGVAPAIVRARMGHMTARMTDVYTDVDSIDQGGNTEAVARLLGVADGGANAETPGVRVVNAFHGLNLDEGDVLRPTPTVLAAMVERYSNILIARICRVSEMAVRKWLKKFGIARVKRVVGRDLPEGEIALLRADLRRALAEKSIKSEPVPANAGVAEPRSRSA